MVSSRDPMPSQRGIEQGATSARWQLVAFLIAILVAALITLELWQAPPIRLLGAHRVVVTLLHWAKQNILSIAAASLIVSLVGLAIPFMQDRLKEVRDRQSVAEDRQRARNRAILIARVRHNWIEGILDQSLEREARIALGLTRVRKALEHRQLVLRQGEMNEQLPIGTTITEIFDRSGGGLLILGAPGSGKTTSLLELARDLLSRVDSTSTEPIPVVLNLSSWAQRRLPLTIWLVDELIATYDVPREIAQGWIEAKEILPLLDGLDEVTEAVRSACVTAINDFRTSQLTELVVCSRTEEYHALTSQLRLDEAVLLKAPTRQQIYDYLETVGAPLAGVRTAIQSDEDLWELLRSPLMLSIVALAYAGRSASDIELIGSAKDRREYLFAEYTRQMFVRRPLTGRYSKQQAMLWLTWLAQSMQGSNQSELYVDRLHLQLSLKLMYKLVLTFGFALLGALAGGILGLVTSIPNGVVGIGVIGALVGALLGFLASGLGIGAIPSAEELRWSLHELRRFSWVVVLGVLIGIGEVVVAIIQGRIVIGIVAATLTILILAMYAGLDVALVTEPAKPNEGIRRSARNALSIGFVGGCGTASAAWLLSSDSGFALSFGLLIFLTFGMVFGGGACLQSIAIRCILILSGSIPLRYVAFLNDMTERLFLRRKGGGFLFIHRMLLEYIALDAAETLPGNR